MSKKLTQAKAEALAIAYVLNGFNKSPALRVVGYTKSYAATTAASELFDNPMVVKAVAGISSRCKAAADVTVAQIVEGLKEIAFPAEGKKVRDSDRNQALAHLAKFKNMFDDRLIIIDREQRELTRSEEIEAKVLANVRLKYGEQIRAEVESQMSAEGELEPFSDSEIING